MIGPRVGPRVGVRVGPAIGVSEDELFPPTSGIPGVTQDPAGPYFPANAAEWTLLRAAAGGVGGNPSSVWNCQEASGSLADAIGTVTLAPVGTGHLYQQSIPGFARKAIMGVDGMANQRWNNTTTAPDPSATSTMWFMWTYFPAAAPAVVRDIAASSATMDLRYTTAARLTGINGASTTGTQTYLNAVFPIFVKHDITNSAFVVYTFSEKIVGTYAATASAILFALGGQTTSASAAGYLYAAMFTGAAAELSDANVKTLMTTLANGAVPPWN